MFWDGIRGIDYAAFDQDITRIALIEPFSSYHSVVMNRFYNPEFVNGIVPGALEAYDLPDLAASLAPRKIYLAGVTDGNSMKSDVEGIIKDLFIIKTAYHLRNADGQLNIKPPETNRKANDLFME